MLFFFSSTRTRGSFEAGMAQLGGHAAFIESQDHPDLTRRYPQGDRRDLRPLFRWHRHPPRATGAIGNGYLNAVAKASRVPVLNMQCDIYHPFQCLADLMTIMEKKGRDLRRKKMVVSWAYAASYQKPMSVPQIADPADAALWHGCGPGASAGVQADARDHGPGPANRRASSAPASRSWMTWKPAFKDADIIYAKSWGAMVHTPDAERRRQDHQEVLPAGSPTSAR